MIDRSKLPSSFEFINVASARAKQLMRGATPRVDPADRKATKIAQQEVLQGEVKKIEKKTPESA